MPGIHNIDVAEMVERRGEAPAPVTGWLDAEDRARVLTSFRGAPVARIRAMPYARSATDGNGSAYVMDADSGMIYLLD